MAKFQKGQRVRAPSSNPFANPYFCGRAGTIIYVSDLLPEANGEQVYYVDFDGLGPERWATEKQLEAE